MALFKGQVKEEKPEERQDEPLNPLEELPEVPELPINTVIAQGITLTGDMRGTGVVQVEGAVEGEISLTEQGALIVTATGRVKGPVCADVIHVAGYVMGDLTARDHLRLEKAGTIEGDVTTSSFVIEDGGRLNGRSTMLKK